MGYMGILFLMYPKPYSIYLRGTIALNEGMENVNYHKVGCKFLGLEGMEKKMKAFVLGYVRTTNMIPFFIPV